MRNTSSVVIPPRQGLLFQKTFLYTSSLSLALFPHFKISHKEYFLNGNEVRVFAIKPFPCIFRCFGVVTLTPLKVNCVLQLSRESGIAMIVHNLLAAGHGASDRPPKIQLLCYASEANFIIR